MKNKNATLNSETLVGQRLTTTFNFQETMVIQLLHIRKSFTSEHMREAA